jgi:hypothetical protein
MIYKIFQVRFVKMILFKQYTYIHYICNIYIYIFALYLLCIIYIVCMHIYHLNYEIMQFIYIFT